MPKWKEKMKFILPEDHEWRNESLCTSPPEVEPQNLAFQRAAVRRGYPVMMSRFFNIGDDIHDQLVRERITSEIHRIPPRNLILAFPSRVWSPNLNYATSLRVRERIDRERATESAILEWVVSLCEIQEPPGNICYSWKILWAPRAGIEPQSKRLQNAGAEEPSRDPSSI